MGVSGCSSITDDDLSDASKADATTTVEGAKLILSLSNSSSSRATGDDLDATDVESGMTSLMIYFTDNTGKIKYIIDDYYANPSDNIVVDLDKKGITTGTFNIYICANITAALKTQLAVTDANILTTIGSISNISEITQNNQFLMLGQAKKDDSGADFTITKGTTINGSVILNRLMAKILVTGLDDDANGSIDGTYAFVNLSDIHFTLQTTNKQYYCMPQTNNEDPNYDMNTLLTTAYAYQSGVSAYFGDQTQYEYGSTGSWLVAEKYDAAKTAGNGYKNGLYCLENTTSAIPTTFSLNKAQLQSVPMMVTTYLRTVLKTIPRVIDETSYNTSTEALNALTETASDGGKAFYTYLGASSEEEQQKAFTTTDALKKHFGTVNDNYISAHSTNNLYYYNIFINGKTFDATNSSIIRNHYYIVNITKIATPFFNKVMEINTKVTGWTLKGTTTQDVDTSGTTK